MDYPLQTTNCANEDMLQWETDMILMSKYGLNGDEIRQWRLANKMKDGKTLAGKTLAGKTVGAINNARDPSQAFVTQPKVLRTPVVAGVRRVVAPFAQQKPFSAVEDCEKPDHTPSYCGSQIDGLYVSKSSSCPVLIEDVVNDEGMKRYTETLLHSVNNSVVYDGAGDLSEKKTGPESKFLELVDDSLLPIRADGWFREGLKKTRKTKHLMFHHPHLLSHTYLQTHPEGVLHVIPGWTRKLLISDLAYRFESAGTTQYRAVIPFLGGLLCSVKTYNCAGVMVCKRCSPGFREHSRHITVDRNDVNILACAEELSPVAEARKKVLGMYMGLQSKMKTRNGFCQAEVMLAPGDPIVKCHGVPLVRPSLSRPGTFFTGCTGYSSDERKTPKMKQNGFKNRHYASKITLDGPMLDFYRDLLSGKECPSIQDESPCTFVRGKHKSRGQCPRHGTELVHISCRTHEGDKHSSHTMSIIEPSGYHEDTPDERKVLFVSCVGEHLHPAPPPVEATAMKLRIFDFLCAQRKWTSLAQLRKAVALALHEVEVTENGPIQLFGGSLTIPHAVLQRRLRMLRPPISKLAVEVGELAMMAADEGNQYVRGLKIVGEKYVVFLGLDDLIAFSSHRMAFAGDATFKTVTEETRTVMEGRWYLYNIVAHASKDRRNGKSIVVFRALVTGLSRDVYCAVWTYFFKSMARGWGLIRGIGDLDSVCLKVPYLPVPPTMESRCCEVGSITMDFDSEEVLGCADALVRCCGGTVEMHQLGMFIGCSVHLDRDLIRRSKDENVQGRSGRRSRELISLYHEYRDAASPKAAKLCLEKIKSFDEGWVNWVERNGMGSMISNTLSTMCSTSRSLGFADTNVVESQNRRGNVLIGTHNRPGEAALKLWDVDRLDLKTLREGNFNNIAIPRGFRVRKDSILCPSGFTSTTSGKRKRSRNGIGPVQKRSQKKKGNNASKVDMCREGRNAEGGGSGSALKVVGNDEVVAIPDRAPASAHIEEMRVSAASEEIRLSNRVEHKISQLLEDVNLIPQCHGEATILANDACTETRTNSLIELLSAVNDSGHSIEKVKRALLDAMRIEAVRRDRHFRNAILNIFKMCMQPLTGRDTRGNEKGTRGNSSKGPPYVESTELCDEVMPNAEQINNSL